VCTIYPLASDPGTCDPVSRNGGCACTLAPRDAPAPGHRGPIVLAIAVLAGALGWTTARRARR
jgi:hypothetical protein